MTTDNERIWPGLTDKEWMIKEEGYKSNNRIHVDNDRPRILDPGKNYLRSVPDTFIYVSTCPECRAERIKRDASEPEEIDSMCSSCYISMCSSCYIRDNIGEIFSRHKT